MVPAALAALHAIMADRQSLTLTRHKGGDEGDGTVYSISLIGTDRPQRFVAADLDELLVIAAGMGPLRRCHTCREEKPMLSAFIRHYGRPENRSQNCKLCERKRVKAYKKRKREQRQERGTE
jgi:hypothetical protein